MRAVFSYDSTASFVHFAYHFTGKERDAESQLDYFGARYYGSALGRFTSPDWSATPQAVPYADLTNPQSLNLYNYMRNNPLTGSDPDGHDGWWTDFGNGLADSTYRPLVQMASHPLDTAAGLGHAAAHPIDTAIAAKNGIIATGKAALSGDGVAIGVGVGTIGMALIPGAEEAEGAEAASTLEKLTSPVIHPSEIIGKTPAEIDSISTSKGLIPKGPDPMSGKGAYVDPVTGQQRVLSQSTPILRMPTSTIRLESVLEQVGKFTMQR
jgi:RHS repeat-associated protein